MSNTDTAIKLVKTGNLLLKNGELDKAIQAYDEAISLDPDYAFAYLQRGDAYHKKGDLKQAAQNFNQGEEILQKLDETEKEDKKEKGTPSVTEDE